MDSKNTLRIFLLLLATAALWVSGASESYTRYGFEQPAAEKEYALLTPLGSEIRTAVNRYRTGSPITRIGVISYRERMVPGGRQYLFKLQMNNELGSEDIWGARIFEPYQGRALFQALFGPIKGYHGKLSDPDAPPGFA